MLSPRVAAAADRARAVAAAPLEQQRRYFAAGLPDRLLRDLERAGAELPLSPRELEVLVLASHGYGVNESADVLIVSRNTVLAHRKSVLRKLGAGNIAHAVAEAIRRELIR